jgi:hypothetical protein
LLDLIQVFVESLDRLFENVCELDLIFNFETLHAVLGEMIVGGVVIETGLDKYVLRRDFLCSFLMFYRVVQGVKAQGKVAKRPVNEGSRTGGLGPGIWAGRWSLKQRHATWSQAVLPSIARNEARISSPAMWIQHMSKVWDYIPEVGWNPPLFVENVSKSFSAATHSKETDGFDRKYTVRPAWRHVYTNYALLGDPRASL